MKRAFIRLFGCILSAIGLSVSYDTTMTVLLGEDAAPGAVFGAPSGSGDSGSGGSGSGNGLLGVGEFLVDGLTGRCDVSGLNVEYNVYLTTWYVGWLNHNYTGANFSAGWPQKQRDYTSNPMPVDFSFSGSTAKYTMSGNFVPLDEAGEVDLCTGMYGIPYGVSTGLGDNWESQPFRNFCIVNLVEAPEPSINGDTYYQAVYLPSSQPFLNMGCCSGGATGTNCRCSFAKADRAYTYKYYNTRSRQWISDETSPFYEPYIFYFYSGCDAGYYPSSGVPEGAVIVFQALQFKYGGGTMNYSQNDVCPPDDDFADLLLSNSGNAYQGSYFKNCNECPSMTSIYNSSEFSPTITNNGSMTRTASAAGVTGVSACRANVDGAKDDTGTFNVVGTCSYKG